jgi:hypothetical protein
MQAKRCARCTLLLPENEFAKQGQVGRQSWCRTCNREYSRTWYRAHRVEEVAKAAARNKVRRAENLGRVLEYLASHPCVDCGEADPVVLQFDHVREQKVTEVMAMAERLVPWNLILDEIAKCDVRCGTCHVRRTAHQVGWRRTSVSAWSELSEATLSQPLRPALSSAPSARLFVCCACHQSLPSDHFAQRPGTRPYKCKSCQRSYSRDHYRRNRSAYLVRVRARSIRFRSENTARVVAYLLEHPCVDCRQGDPVVLVFDHVRGAKYRDICQMIRDDASWERILQEIAKCDVRCVNCHFRRHAVARTSRKVQMLITPPSQKGSSDLRGDPPWLAVPGDWTKAPQA